MAKKKIYVRWFADLRSKDVPAVGGKNASLGEMISTLKKKGISVPNGFATTSAAYWKFLDDNKIREKVHAIVKDLQSGSKSLSQVGKSIRRLFLDSQFPDEIAEQIRAAYRELGRRYRMKNVDVAVRSSATAEDLPEASFAGQQETFLNVKGEKALIEACRKCYASLFTNRAISYREEKGFDHMDVALSIGVQKMVRSDKASAGVMFSIDTETGFPDVVVINGAWGLGENVVQGSITPDEYVVFKPVLRQKQLTPIIEKNLGGKAKKMIYSARGGRAVENVRTTQQERQSFVLKDKEILQLAQWAVDIEKHYGKPMDMEWAKNGKNGGLFIVQARPETVQSLREASSLKSYTLKEKGKRLLTGLSIGEAIAVGKVNLIKSSDDIDQFKDGSLLVTEMTDPDWVPIMRRSAGIITDYGGRTCHAAIVSRELGIPAVVGTGEATKVLKDGQEITLSCAEGDQGYVYDGILAFQETQVSLDVPKTKTQVMLNIASPSAAMSWWRLPTEGVGLARMEFIINNIIKIHPMALIHFNELKDRDTRKQIQEMTWQYKDKTEYFVDHLARGIAKIAVSQYPHPVIVRMSDFKTNEYANLIGGKQFEPEESNPMLGWRGASRYYSEGYREGFELECRAIRRVREQIGLTNVLIMIPFCRTVKEADRVLAVLAKNGLKRGKNGLEVYVMCEIPSNVVQADQFAKRFDGFSIGSNDLTQLALGVDRDSSQLADLFDERNETVKRLIRSVLKEAHKAKTKVGICGQAPSDYPDFAAFLVEQGIDSISLNPDSVIGVKKRIAKVEQKLKRRKKRKR
ncbi:MAG: phosphoenolpyruvate synthase [candidate division Zixibacteria bacterium SM23_81]|nr:MAG: phosphoenolpyruvate synthase [candidate division Zixibacteria bacterium SM23_81]